MRKLVILVVVIGVITMALGAARNNNFIQDLEAEVIQGWTEESEIRTWTYSSADDPVFVASVDADVTNAIYPSVRVRLKQGGDYKYFIVHKVELSGANTLVTLYGGTDYDLANSAITNVAFSSQRFPINFPVDPYKWTVSVVDNTNYTLNNPTVNNWVNIGSFNFDIPIGVWKISTHIYVLLSAKDSEEAFVSYALSTVSTTTSNLTTNGLLESRFISAAVVIPEPTDLRVGEYGYSGFYYSATSKTTLYLMVMAGVGPTPGNYQIDIAAQGGRQLYARRTSAPFPPTTRSQ